MTFTKQKHVRALLNDVSEDELDKIVGSYENEKVTDHLYAFGLMLIGEITQRSDRIESKANTVIGWATAILAFLFTQTDKLAPSVKIKGVAPALQAFAIVIAAVAVLALVFAYRALKSRKGWTWPSDKDWFCETELVSEERIKKLHLKSLHGVRQTHRRITDEKGRSLQRAEWLLVAAAVLLAVGVVVRIVFSLVVLLF